MWFWTGTTETLDNIKDNLETTDTAGLFMGPESLAYSETVENITPIFDFSSCALLTIKAGFYNGSWDEAKNRWEQHLVNNLASRTIDGIYNFIGQQTYIQRLSKEISKDAIGIVIKGF